MPRVVHFEIVANDPKSAKEFYEAVFGWEFNQLDGQEYWVIKTGEDSQPGINGGLTGKDPHSSDPSSRMTNTIDVPSIEDFSKKIIAKGGQVMAKMPIPNIGLLAICKDNEGISFGIPQKDANAK
jgi:predicted enzyme related to lactoylglutathione lyase